MIAAKLESAMWSSSLSLPALFQPFASRAQQLRCGRQVPVGVLDVFMSQKRRQHRQAALDILTPAVPRKERVHCESMADVVQPRTVSLLRTTEPDVARELCEHAADGTGGQGCLVWLGDKETGNRGVANECIPSACVFGENLDGG